MTRAPRADPAGDEAGRQRGQQRARRVGGGEDPGLGLAQPELVDVVRQQRRDRREEGDVEEDHRRGEQEQPAHRPIQSAQANSERVPRPLASATAATRRGGRAVECAGLENRWPSQGGSWVRIPPPPLAQLRQECGIPAERPGYGQGRHPRPHAGALGAAGRAGPRRLRARPRAGAGDVRADLAARQPRLVGGGADRRHQRHLGGRADQLARPRRPGPDRVLALRPDDRCWPRSPRSATTAPGSTSPRRSRSACWRSRWARSCAGSSPPPRSARARSSARSASTPCSASSSPSSTGRSSGSRAGPSSKACRTPPAATSSSSATRP